MISLNKINQKNLSSSSEQIAAGITPDYKSRSIVICATSKMVTQRHGVRQYERMLILRPDMFDEEKDRQLAKLESYLLNNGAENIDCAVKGKQKMSYPIAGYWNGVYVLFHFSGVGSIAKGVHKLLANPDVESQGNILRWINLRLQ